MRKIIHICDACGKEDARRCPICDGDACSDHYTQLNEDLSICTKHLLGLYISIKDLQKMYENVTYLDLDYWNKIKLSEPNQWVTTGVSYEGEMLYAGIHNSKEEAMELVNSLMNEDGYRFEISTYYNGNFYHPKITLKLIKGESI